MRWAMLLDLGVISSILPYDGGGCLTGGFPTPSHFVFFINFFSVCFPDPYENLLFSKFVSPVLQNGMNCHSLKV
ncbi:hypothetical protein BDV33DRAFT_165966 [Aspergillus novoparasiticus]|uniref:Secreted protein n=1 Tax=Aspergillus novoparasiticus TaxID=986946 RepID=A0A5N6F2S4_9EURO|nr:hypothetical protein BDV33DRAFT_165966 [Aspergillus novoparasiticus]